MIKPLQELIEKNNELLKKQKEYERKSTTTDPAGNILLIKNFPNEKLLIEFCIPKLQITEKHDIIEGKKPLKEKKKTSEDTTLPKIKESKKDLPKHEKETEKKKSNYKPNKYDKNNKDKVEEIAPFVPSGSNFE